MTISTADWKRYIARLRRISDKAAEEMQKYVQLHGFADTDALIDYAWALATKYGEAAATAACDMFDAVAKASGVTIPGALPAETATYGETARAVQGALNQGAAKVQDTVGRLVKQTGADTTLQNAEHYGAEFAWVPMGDTCSFCRMLASNGWQRQSKKAMKGGHAEHIHANCDCQYAVRFDGKGGVAGYDPAKYKAEYDAAEGDTWQEKLNAMRRAQYKQDGEKIRAQKRIAYHERQRNRKLSDARNVDLKYIESENYRMKFRGVTGNATVDDSISHSARRILKHRSGTGFEDLVLLDADTGSVIHVLDTGKTENAVIYDSATSSAIERAHSRGRRIVAIHNHPDSLPPSLDDAVSMLDHGYDFGIVVAHDGTVYQFTAAAANFSSDFCELVHNNIAYQLETGGHIEEVWYNMLEEYGVHIERR